MKKQTKKLKVVRTTVAATDLGSVTGGGVNLVTWTCNGVKSCN